MAGVKIVIWGKPKSKARPRAQRRGAHTHIFTPTSEFEADIVRQMLPFRGSMVHEDRVTVVIRFYGHHGAQDLDNMAKLYVDALVKAKVIREDNSRRLGRLLLDAPEPQGEARVVINVQPYRSL